MALRGHFFGRQNYMLNRSILLSAFAALAFTAVAAQSAPMNKCVADGAVTYQQGPCPSNQPRKDPTLAELNAAEKQKRQAAAASTPAERPRAAGPAPNAANPVNASFRCDGRQHCSQMKSCEEAKYFLAHCPGVKMDGDRDGIPCEEQWCSR
nr:excalibur calcium-binding domain-containing protein [uncultured Roseateles sp.]